MIELNNINIHFDSPIIENGSLQIYPGVSLIVGKSGTGKTTLLYRIALISEDKRYNYRIDNHTIDLNNEKKSLSLERTILVMYYKIIIYLNIIL